MIKYTVPQHNIVACFKISLAISCSILSELPYISSNYLVAHMLRLAIKSFLYYMFWKFPHRYLGYFPGLWIFYLRNTALNWNYGIDTSLFPGVEGIDDDNPDSSGIWVATEISKKLQWHLRTPCTECKSPVKLVGWLSPQLDVRWEVGWQTLDFNERLGPELLIFKIFRSLYTHTGTYSYLFIYY